jgi:threonine aldolase
MPHGLLEQARVERKRLGGAMRQVGILAAAGLVALDSQIARLADDHERAARIAAALSQRVDGVQPVATNIVAVEHPSARAIAGTLEQQGVLAGTVSLTRLRLVTHAGLTDEDVETICEIIARLDFPLEPAERPE